MFSNGIIEKERANILKHGVSFYAAQKVFLDNDRKVFKDDKHSKNEERYFCIGKVD